MSTTTSAEQITQIRIDHLHESPFNPRKVFHEQGLDELAADITSIGRVLQPLLVRPRIPPLFAHLADAADATVGYEIVFGHRRFRAGQMAGLSALPCMVRAMTDEEVKRAQISENLQREDVHAIEEAEGFDALMRDHGQTADDIAEQTGKSRSYVYARLKLLQAAPRVRQACLEKRIDAEVALLIARLRTTKLQEAALRDIEGKNIQLEDGGKRSYRQARELLAERYTLDLKKEAIFAIDDLGLVPSAGACTSCPKRCGNAPEFADLASKRSTAWNLKDDNSRGSYGWANGNPWLCTDPDCFAAKKIAHLKAEAAALASKGAVVVAGNAARAAVSAVGEVKGSYIAAAKVKGKQSAPLVKIQDPRTGKVFDAYKVADLKAAGVALAEPSHSVHGRSSYNHEEDRLAREARKARGDAATARRTAQWHALRKIARDRSRDGFDLALIVGTALHLQDESGDYDGTRLLTAAWGQTSTAGLVDALDTMSRDDKALLLLDIALIQRIVVDGYDVERGLNAHNLDAALAHYGMDPDAAAAEGAPTPATAGASADESEAGAGLAGQSTPAAADAGEVDDDDQADEDEGQADGLHNSLTTPADAGGSEATGGDAQKPHVPWPFPKQDYGVRA